MWFYLYAYYTSVYSLESSFSISNSSHYHVDNQGVNIEVDKIWEGTKQINDNVLQSFYAECARTVFINLLILVVFVFVFFFFTPQLSFSVTDSGTRVCGQKDSRCYPARKSVLVYTKVYIRPDVFKKVTISVSFYDFSNLLINNFPQILPEASPAESPALETVQGICTYCGPSQLKHSFPSLPEYPKRLQCTRSQQLSLASSDISPLHGTLICEVLGLSAASPLSRQFLEVRHQLVSPHSCVFSAPGESLTHTKKRCPSCISKSLFSVANCVYFIQLTKNHSSMPSFPQASPSTGVVTDTTAKVWGGATGSMARRLKSGVIILLCTKPVTLNMTFILQVQFPQLQCRNQCLLQLVNE